MRKFVFKSSAHYYGCEQDDPAFFTEDMRRPHPPRTRDRARHRRGRGGRRRVRRPATTTSTTTVLRCANVLGPHLPTSHARMFSLPLVPMVLGFDPRYQFVHEDDVVHALEHAAFNDLPGIYNVAADGVLALSEVIGLLGKRPLPILPPWGTGADRRAAAPARLPLPRRDGQPAALRPRGSTTAGSRRPGFNYGYTSREAVIKFGEHLRLHPVLRGTERELHLREGGRGVPALEPARAARRAAAARSRSGSDPGCASPVWVRVRSANSFAPPPDGKLGPRPAYTVVRFGRRLAERRERTTAGRLEVKQSWDARLR